MVECFELQIYELEKQRILVKDKFVLPIHSDQSLDMWTNKNVHFKWTNVRIKYSPHHSFLIESKNCKHAWNGYGRTEINNSRMYAEFNFCQSYNIIIFLLVHDWDLKSTYNSFYYEGWVVPSYAWSLRQPTTMRRNILEEKKNELLAWSR